MTTFLTNSKGDSSIQTRSLNYLQKVSPFMYFLDIFICKNAACSFKLTWTLPCSPGYDWLMHPANEHKQARENGLKRRSIKIIILLIHTRVQLQKGANFHNIPYHTEETAPEVFMNLTLFWSWTIKHLTKQFLFSYQRLMKFSINGLTLEAVSQYLVFLWWLS